MPGGAARVLLPGRLVLHRSRHPRQGRDHLRTPLDGAFTKPVASATLAALLEEKGVHLVTEFNTGEVVYDADGRGGKLVGYDGREVPFDLAVVVPLHSGADYVGRSPGLGDELNFVPTDKATLQSRGAPEHLRHRRRDQRARPRRPDR